MPKSHLLSVFRSPRRVRAAALLAAASLLACVLLFSTVVSAATSARQGAPGTWSLAASGIRTVSGQIGTARTADGVLHVIWSRGGAGTPWALLETTVTPSGKVSAPATIISGWSRIDDVDATFSRGRPLTIGFTGSKTDTTGDPTNGLNVATKTGRWTVGAAAVYRTDLAGSSVPAVGYTGSGELIEAWSAGGKITVHVGSDPAKPAASFGERGGNVVLPQNPTIVGVKNGVAWALIGWCGEAGVFEGVATIPPDPRIGLDARVFPGSSTTRCPAAARTALTWGRDGGGHFAAASVASERKVLVWPSSGDDPMTAAGGAGIKQQVALVSDLGSRLWVGWRDANSNTLRLRRSNRSKNTWGAVVSTKLPPSQDSLYQLTLDGQADRVDVIARTTKGSAVSLFHTQMWPGLSVEATTKTGLVTVAVTDAGEPVAGASVQIGDHSLRTNQHGEASLELSAGPYRVVASKPKYVSANTSVRVKSA